MDAAEINGIGMKEEAFKLCQEYLGSPWNNIKPCDFQFSVMSGGQSSILYRCSLGNNVTLENSRTSRQVLLRFYGPMQDEEHIIISEAIIFVILSEKKLGPRLLGLFPTGRLEEFIPSRTLGTDDIRRWSTTIAKLMAKVHALNVPVRKVPDQIPRHLKRWLKELEEYSQRKNKKSYPLRDIVQEEAAWIFNKMEKSRSPIVFCHNDLQGGNILLREDSGNKQEPNLMFIDFEFGGYHYRGFDIANHFIEWAIDYNTPDPPYFIQDTSKIPTKEEKIGFVHAYLHQLVDEGMIEASAVEAETEKILKEIKLFRMVSCFYWAVWADKMKFENENNSFYKEHGKLRWSLYWKLKEKFIKENLFSDYV